MVELLGHELHVYASSGKQDFVATVDVRGNPQVGESLELVADMGTMHLFDKATERAIR